MGSRSTDTGATHALLAFPGIVEVRRLMEHCDARAAPVHHNIYALRTICESQFSRNPPAPIGGISVLPGQWRPSHRVAI